MINQLYRRSLGLIFLGLLSASNSTLAQTDPGVAGPFTTVRAEYDYGDTAFEFGGFPTEMRAVVYYPGDLSGGPFPLVVFLHGWHPSCYQGFSAFLEWPCSGAHQQIPSYAGYEYEQEILASHGYIVVSISAAGVNAKDTMFFDVGMLWRAQLLQRHLDQWNTFNTVGDDPFGTLFVGKVDLTRIGTMGHSRGGEGVARHYTYNRDEVPGSPYVVKAVFPLAPVNFSREDLFGTNLEVLLPYCDGDVADLQGAHFFDDAQYIPGDDTNKHFMLVMGGNHSFYNTIWAPGGWPAATWDDWRAFEDPSGNDPFCSPTQPDNHRLTQEQVHGTLHAYLTAFMRVYLGGETQFLPLLKGDADPPPSALTSEILASYHAKESSRLDLNRMLTDDALSMNDLGGAVTQSGLTGYDLCGGAPPHPVHCLDSSQLAKRQPHTTPSARSSRRGLSQLRFGWDDASASLTNELPVGAGDVSRFAVVQFRASVNYTDPRNVPGVPQDVSVTLTDRTGNSASIQVSSASAALFYPPGEVGAVPKIIQNTIRIPLSQFPGVDLTGVQSVQLQFDQVQQGALLLTDLGFAD